ncbi:radical SAM protein (TIGR04043 family) [Motilibacter rhizosphaerae]|uniref:Radical SAM protein (TIGR04043 family) n=1 Tax=Motilibacter rhizosphaerae TaxID=598652 RepID=A0A4Q7NUH4_9ACTN|nr:MSMEG_0568 family radical SAM protein [Motilibacter rhizosphaerae]RZS90841.1 radical SAM protein (TIGR04043 family) [Motilibacter rhizosphaerae]
MTAVPLHTRVDVAIRGIRSAAPVARRGGAGPSDDGHLLLGGAGSAVPLDPTSPYEVADGRLLLDGVDTGVDVAPVSRPLFYDLLTSDGVPYEKLARLHGKDVLATTVVQTCVRYAESQRCRFCAIEAPIATGATTRVKSPAQLAEVAEAAVRLDGVRQMVMTTGTSAARDRGARHLARCVRAVKQAVPHLPVQVQCEPPADLDVLQELKDAGADAIGIHVESLDDAVRARWMPGKSTVPLTEYDAAWREAVRVFGWNRVSTYLLVGLGEDPDELVAGAARLAAMGVYPFVVPFRPLAGTLAAGEAAPDPALVADVTARVAEALRAEGMRAADQRAGCAACGACSALSAAGA